MLAALVVSLTAAAITAAVKSIRRRLPKSKAEPAEDFPVRLTCRDATEFYPGSGYREGLQFEVFNHSDEGLEGYMDHESFGEELHQRSLAEYVRESTPYVEVIGFGTHTAEITTAAAEADRAQRP